MHSTKAVQVIALLFSFMTNLSAKAQIWVGIDNQVADDFAVSQWQDEWCWAASTQMILNYYHIPITQSQIVSRIHGNFADQGGSDFDISSALNGWAISGTGGAIIVQSQEGEGMPPPRLLLNELSSQHPILLAFATGPDSGHAVVVTAAAYFPTANGPLVTSLVTRDPWPSPDHIESIGRQEYDGSDLSGFATIVRAYWIIRATED